MTDAPAKFYLRCRTSRLFISPGGFTPAHARAMEFDDASMRRWDLKPEKYEQVPVDQAPGALDVTA